MSRITLTSLAAFLLAAGPALAQSEGDETAKTTDAKKMALTGSGVRKVLIFRVCQVESYLEEGRTMPSAKALADADVPKQLRIVMLRAVPGDRVVSEFTAALRANFPAPAFEDEIKIVAGEMRGRTVRRGDELWLTHIPEVGLRWRHVGGETKLIKNVEFSKAVWNNYFGERNVSPALKAALVSRLPRE